MPMNIEQFRTDFVSRLREERRSVNSVALEYGVEQASLSRFISGKRGLSGESVFSLWPFVYGGDARASPDQPPASNQSSNPEAPSC